MLEKDPRLQDWADREQCALLAFIAPYTGVRVSPVAEAYASIGVQEEFGVETFLDRCAMAKVDKLHLLVNSPGGGVVSSYKVARALRSSFKYIRVFVPHMAASGGTLLALAGNEIVMGIMSHLSPLDPQVSYKGASISSNSVLRCFERFSGAFGQMLPEEAPYPIRCMTEKLDPLIMEEMCGTTLTCMRYVREILEAAGYDEDDAADKALELTTQYNDHSTVLGRDSLIAREYKVVPDSKYRKEWEVMRNWLRSHIARSESVHHMRYCLPKKKKAASNNGKHTPTIEGKRNAASPLPATRKDGANGKS